MTLPGLPLLETFTRGTREAAPFIVSLAQIGHLPTLSRAQAATLQQLGLEAVPLSANEILRQLKIAGLSARRQDALALIRTTRNDISKSSYIKSVRNDFLPNPDRFPVAPYRMVDNFHYQVRYDAIDPLTGERSQSYMTVASANVLTKNQVYDVAAQYYESIPENYPMALSGFTVDQAYQNAEGIVPL